MTLRCGCANEGDATVFGEVHECTVDPSLKTQCPTPWWQPRPYEHVLDSADLDPGEG